MQKNGLIRINSSIYRVLAIKDDKVLVIDTLSLKRRHSCYDIIRIVKKLIII